MNNLDKMWDDVPDEWIEQNCPHSLHAEQAVIGALLLNGELIDECGDLKFDDFFDESHKKLFKLIQTQAFGGKSTDIVTMFELLKEKEIGIGLDELTALSLSSTGYAGVSAQAGIIKEKAARRHLRRAGGEITLLSEKVGVKAQSLIEQAQGKLDALMSSPTKRDPKPLSEILLEHMNVLQDRSEGNVRVIPTGLDDLDRVLAGGIRPGNVVVLGARPSVGKTALALSLAAHIAEKHQVLFLSMEMSAQEVSDRIIAMVGQIPLNAVMQANPDDVEMWNGVTRAVNQANGLKFHIDEQPALTLGDVRQKARNVKRRGGLDMLVIDYLQLMQGRNDDEKRNYQLEEISRGVKAIAKELEIGVIELVQLNRGAEQRGGRYRMADIRDCGGIEQDADVIGFLHRPIKENPDLGDNFKDYAWLQIEKNRQGQLGDIHLTYIAPQTRFAGWYKAIPQAVSATYKRKGTLDD